MCTDETRPGQTLCKQLINVMLRECIWFAQCQNHCGWKSKTFKTKSNHNFDHRTTTSCGCFMYMGNNYLFVYDREGKIQLQILQNSVKLSDELSDDCQIAQVKHILINAPMLNMNMLNISPPA